MFKLISVNQVLFNDNFDGKVFENLFGRLKTLRKREVSRGGGYDNSPLTFEQKTEYDRIFTFIVSLIKRGLVYSKGSKTVRFKGTENTFKIKQTESNVFTIEIFEPGKASYKKTFSCSIREEDVLFATIRTAFEKGLGDRAPLGDYLDPKQRIVVTAVRYFPPRNKSRSIFAHPNSNIKNCRCDTLTLIIEQLHLLHSKKLLPENFSVAQSKGRYSRLGLFFNNSGKEIEIVRTGSDYINKFIVKKLYRNGSGREFDTERISLLNGSIDIFGEGMKKASWFTKFPSVFKSSNRALFFPIIDLLKFVTRCRIDQLTQTHKKKKNKNRILALNNVLKNLEI